MVNVCEFYDAGLGFDIRDADPEFDDETGDLVGIEVIDVGYNAPSAYAEERATLHGFATDPEVAGTSVDDGSLTDDGPAATDAESRRGSYYDVAACNGIGACAEGCLHHELTRGPRAAGPARWDHVAEGHVTEAAAERLWLAKPTAADPPLWGEYRMQALLRERRFQHIRKWLRVQALLARTAKRKRQTQRLRRIQARCCKALAAWRYRYRQSCRIHCPREEWAMLYLNKNHIEVLDRAVRWITAQ